MIAHIVCRFVGHHRSVSSAQRIEGVWHSRCKRCGENIVRVRQSKWRIESIVLRRVEKRNAISRKYRADLS